MKNKLRKFFLTLAVISCSVGAFAKVDFTLPIAIIFLLYVFISASWDLLHVVLVIVLVDAAPIYFPKQLWLVPASNFSIPFVLSTLIVWPIEPARKMLSWFRGGNVDEVSKILILATGIFSAFALILWALWSDNLGVGVSMMKSVSQNPKWLILGIVIPVFALINALSEEVVYRGVLQEALNTVWADFPFLVLALQASAFAAAHVSVGFPNGKVGYVMTFIFASALGYLRARTKGILAPYLAHILADLVIGYYLCFKVLA